MRLNDVRDETKVTENNFEKYKAVLENKHMIARDKLFKSWIGVKQGRTEPARSVGFTA